MSTLDIMVKKIKREYDAFCSETAKKPSSEIVADPQLAYELVFKTELNELMESDSIEFSKKTMQALISKENTLEYLFSVIKDQEQMYMDRVIACIEDLENLKD